MNKDSWIFCLIIFVVSLSSLNAGSMDETFNKSVLPLLNKYCTDCHNPDKKKGKVDLDGKRDFNKLMSDKHLWFSVMDQIEFGEMPPKKKKQPSKEEKAIILSWIKGEFTQNLAQKQKKEGRSKFRRLTHREYQGVFEDLFGFRPSLKKLPDDGRVNGYTKVSSAMQLSSDEIYNYFTTAEEMLSKYAFKRPPNPKHYQPVVRSKAMESGQSKGHNLVLDDGWIVSFNTDLYSGRLERFRATVPGIHKIRMHVYAYQTDKPLPFALYAGHTSAYPQVVRMVDVQEAPPGKPAIIETEVYLNANDSLRLVPLGIGVQVPKNHNAKKCKGPGLAVQWVEDVRPQLPLKVDGWLTADFPEDLKKRLQGPRVYLRKKGPYKYDKVSHDEFIDIMKKTFKRVGASIYRRDLTEIELNNLLENVRVGLKEERNAKEIITESIVQMLSDPEFFCVVESPGKLNDFQLAARLARFIWNSTPDEELLNVARLGKLQSDSELIKQTDRMLKDSRSQRFVTDFLDQWLNLSTINDTTPDKKLYPEYNSALKFFSVQETRMTFQNILDQNLTVREFVDPTEVYMNYSLAKHYGIDGVKQVPLKKMKAPKNSAYGGIWTQPAIMKITADGSSTSPVRRGVWIAERLLGKHISPPPANVEPVQTDTSGAKTLRQQLEMHSDSPSCASCHKKFDPYGFALESFDPIGQYREKYREIIPELAKLPYHKRKKKQVWKDGLPVDASGITPEGHSFQDIKELRKYLSSHPEKLAWGVTWHLVTYATGEESSALDREAIGDIVKASAKKGYGLRSLIHELVKSKLFRFK